MKLKPLDDEEIEKRLPVWIVLADTFLDTELDEGHYEHMAERLASSGYTVAEIEWIYRNEVSPAFLANLMGVAGEWAGWSDEFVRERVLEKRGSNSVKIADRLLLENSVDAEWRKIERHLGELGR